jgi:hypothetical protein
MIQVKLDVYNYFKMVDSFFVDYTNEITFNDYVDHVNKRKYYPYDMICVDNGRAIIIPIIEGRILIMGRNIPAYKDANVTKYDSFALLDNHEYIDLVNFEDDGRD